MALVAHPICATHRPKWCATNSLFSTSANLTRFQLNRQIFVNFWRGVYRTFSIQTNGELCIKYGIVSFKIVVFPFLEHIFGRCFTKNPFLALRKWKMNFFVQRKLKLPKSTLFTISICTHVHNMGSFEQTMLWLWPQLAHLAWKPWNFIQDSSFVWTLFQNVCNIPSLLFFLATRSHNMTENEGFIFFWFFLNFLCRFQNAAKSAGVTAPRSG
jgi:hypothetical protein